MSRRDDPLVSRRLRVVEFLLYVGTLTALIVATSLVVGTAFADEVVGTAFGASVTATGPIAAKVLLFVVGFLLFGIGALDLRPPPAWKDGKRFSLDREEDSTLDSLVHRLPPLRDRPVPIDQRIGRGAKWFTAGLLVLGTSFAMEAVLGIGIGP